MSLQYHIVSTQYLCHKIVLLCHCVVYCAITMTYCLITLAIVPQSFSIALVQCPILASLCPIEPSQCAIASPHCPNESYVWSNLLFLCHLAPYCVLFGHLTLILSLNNIMPLLNPFETSQCCVVSLKFSPTDLLLSLNPVSYCQHSCYCVIKTSIFAVTLFCCVIAVSYYVTTVSYKVTLYSIVQKLHYSAITVH